MTNTGPVDVVVLLGSHWADLENVTTRWHQVVRRWAQRPDVRAVHVVDFPRLRPGRAVVEQQDSWLPSVTSWRCRVPVVRRHRVLDDIGWRAAARTLMTALPPAAGGHVVVATTPVWAPVLGEVSTGAIKAARTAARTGFDAYDDWRALPAVQEISGRIAAGYRAARFADAVTFGSPGLAARLGSDLNLHGTVVRNGVDADAFARPSPAPVGLPADPFAVYVGMVQERVDIDLLATTARALPTVVAGPVADAPRQRLEAAGVICLGAVPPSQVPGLLSRAAVGLVPHVVDALTLSMDPLKIYEYRAAGLPVVATRVAGSDLDGVSVVDQFDVWTTTVTRAATRGRSLPAAVRDWADVAGELFAVHAGAVPDVVVTP
jgi:glycosyltransferase involved in cell wall biosynthesis